MNLNFLKLSEITRFNLELKLTSNINKYEFKSDLLTIFFFYSNEC